LLPELTKHSWVIFLSWLFRPKENKCPLLAYISRACTRSV